MSELRSNNQVLSERLESLSRSFNSYGSHGSSSVQMSLLNEMEMSTSGSDSDRSLYLRRYYTRRISISAFSPRAGIIPNTEQPKEQKKKLETYQYFSAMVTFAAAAQIISRVTIFWHIGKF